MKLESSLIGDSDKGMMKIQSQLVNLMVQLWDIKRGKEVQEELWCTRCRTLAHHTNNFSTLINCVAAGAPNSINTQAMPWCRIFHTRGHKSEECLYLQKNVCLYCKFCKSVGHYEKYCRALQLMQEKTMDTYLMKNDEKMQAKRVEP